MVIKHLLYFSFGSLLLTISCSSEKHKIESELFSCIIDVTANDEVALSEKLDNYEQLLITSKVLENNSGKAYYNLYTKLANGEKIAIPDSDPEFPDLFSFFPCYLKMMKAKGSSQTKFIKIWNDMLSSEKRDNQAQAQIIISHLSANEFEIPFYRLVSLISIYNFTKLGSALPNPAGK
ncbi:MAG: hypothetical protein JXQ87_07505 [Bacteroidia bacterium]